MKNSKRYSKNKNKKALILEGAASAIDISGSYHFNQHREFNSRDNIQQVWIKVGSYLEKSISKIESEKCDFIISE